MDPEKKVEDDFTVLQSIKKAIGVDPSIVFYDSDILMYINTSMSVLSQLGVEPTMGLKRVDVETKWEDIYTDASLSMIETYLIGKVKLSFDPPANSFTVSLLKENLQELEWRLTIAAEILKKEEDQ